MRKLLSRIIASVSLVSLIFSTLVPWWREVVLAAPGLGSAVISIGTGHNNAGDADYASADGSAQVTVGKLSYLKIDLTVGADGIAADSGNVTVQINPNLFAGNWNAAPASELSNLNPESIGKWLVNSTPNTEINFSASSATENGLITIQANQQLNADDVIHIYAVIEDDHFALAAAPLEIKTRDTSEATLTAIDPQPTIATIAEPDLHGSVTLSANAVVGTVGRTKITFIPPRALAANDSLVLTMPSHFSVPAGALTVVEQTFTGGGIFSCSGLIKTITCTTNDAVNSDVSGYIVIGGDPGIQTLWHTGSATNLDNFRLLDHAAGAVIASDSTVVVDQAQLASQLNAAIHLGANSVAGSDGLTTLTFTPPRTMSPNDSFALTLPPNISIPEGALAIQSQNFTGGGKFTCNGIALTGHINCSTDGVVNAHVEGKMVFEGFISNADSGGPTNVGDFYIYDNSAEGQPVVALDDTVPVDATTLPPDPLLPEIFPTEKVPFIDELNARKDFQDWEKKFGIAEVTDGNQDSDGDGISDEEEFRHDTDPMKVDTDGDSLSDGQEILERGTDPNDAKDPGLKEAPAVQVMSLRQGQVVDDSQPLIRGIGPIFTELEVVMKNSNNKEKVLGKTLTDGQGIFIFTPPEPLKDGTYRLMVRKPQAVTASLMNLVASIAVVHAADLTTDPVGKIELSSKPLILKINSKLDVTPPNLKKLADVSISDEALKGLRLEIKDNKPVLIGKAGFNNEVIATWSSIVLTSSLIADSTAGDFSVQPRGVLPAGHHEVYVQAIRPKDRALSKTIKISFDISTVDGVQKAVVVPAPALQKPLVKPLRPATPEQVAQKQKEVALHAAAQNSHIRNENDLHNAVQIVQTQQKIDVLTVTQEQSSPRSALTQEASDGPVIIKSVDFLTQLQEFLQKNILAVGGGVIFVISICVGIIFYLRPKKILE